MNVKHLNESKKTWLITICLLLLGILGFFRMITERITLAFESSIQKEVIEISMQNKIQIENEINTIQQFMASLATEVAQININETQALLTKLNGYLPLYAFYNMGILYPDGTCFTTDDKIMDLSHTEYYQQGLMGQAMVTKSYPSANGDGEMLNIFSIPVFKENQILCLLTATYQSSQFARLMDINSFQGNSQNMIVDPSMGLIVTIQDGKVNPYDTLLPIIKDLSNQLLDNQCFSFQYQNVDYLSSIVKMDIEDWYLLTYIEKDIAFARLYQLQKEIFWIVGGLVILFGTTMLIVYLLKKRYQQKVLKLTFYNEHLQQKNSNYLQWFFKQLSNEQKTKYHIMVFDIDGFKAIKLGYGPSTADTLLSYICQVFKEETPQIEIFHHLDDHFIGLLPYQTSNLVKIEIQKVLDRIKEDIHQEICLPFRLSIGFCKVEQDLDLNSILLKAMLARKTIKGNTQFPYIFYQDTMRTNSLLDLKISTMFELALKNNHFSVYYQPKYDTRSNQIIGSEALVRWNHHQDSIIDPSMFIPLFETNGMIVQLDQWVVQKVCQDMQKMRAQNIDIVPVSINLSRRHLQSLDIIREIAKLIKEMQLDPSKLAFEITESAFYDDEQSMLQMVESLHQIGCRVDMDDYGTGISNLSSLANIDFDVIKLDRSFIKGIGQVKMEALIKVTIDLAQKLDLQLIAEGVETSEQIRFLSQNGCYYVQGYFYSKPLTCHDYINILSKKTINSQKNSEKYNDDEVVG